MRITAWQQRLPRAEPCQSAKAAAPPSHRYGTILKSRAGCVRGRASLPWMVATKKLYITLPAPEPRESRQRRFGSARVPSAAPGRLVLFTALLDSMSVITPVVMLPAVREVARLAALTGRNLER